VKLLFVCTGNTCRSSMAEALARRELENRGLSGLVTVRSAGTSTVSGLLASHHAIGIMTEMGLDILNHRSSMLNRDLVESSDLVLTMTGGHRRIVLDECPGAAQRIYTLAGYAGVGGDVPDPFGGDRETYRSCAVFLHRLILLAVDRLLRESRQSGGFR
jgi:protein-tyrosine phosphatase